MPKCGGDIPNMNIPVRVDKVEYSDDGGNTPDYSPFFRASAEVKYFSGTEGSRRNEMEARGKYRIRMNKRKGVTPQMRVVLLDTDEVLNITGVGHVGAYRQYLQLDCVQDQG